MPGQAKPELGSHFDIYHMKRSMSNTTQMIPRIMQAPIVYVFFLTHIFFPRVLGRKIILS